MKKTEIKDKELLEHIDSLPGDGREIFLLGNDSVRVSAVSATRMLNEMRANFNTGLIETYVLGQGYIAGALLSSEVKGNDRIQLSIECGGPIKGMNIESWACGAVRGYLTNNPIPLEKPLESLDTTFLYGPGFLSISKILEGSKVPFTGQIMMEYGNLANDLALYYQQSEQTPTLFYFSIKFDEKGRVIGAGGLFIQALPGCSEDILAKLQEKSKSLRHLGKAIADGENIKDYVTEEFSEFGPRWLEHSPIGFSCPCSREHFIGYLKNLPKKEKEEILEGKFPLVLECFNCGTLYKFEKSEVEALFQED